MDWDGSAAGTAAPAAFRTSAAGLTSMLPTDGSAPEGPVRAEIVSALKRTLTQQSLTQQSTALNEAKGEALAKAEAVIEDMKKTVSDLQQQLQQSQLYSSLLESNQGAPVMYSHQIMNAASSSSEWRADDDESRYALKLPGQGTRCFGGISEQGFAIPVQTHLHGPDGEKYPVILTDYHNAIPKDLHVHASHGKYDTLFCTLTSLGSGTSDTSALVYVADLPKDLCGLHGTTLPTIKGNAGLHGTNAFFPPHYANDLVVPTTSTSSSGELLEVMGPRDHAGMLQPKIGSICRVFESQHIVIREFLNKECTVVDVKLNDTRFGKHGVKPAGLVWRVRLCVTDASPVGSLDQKKLVESTWWPLHLILFDDSIMDVPPPSQPQRGSLGGASGSSAPVSTSGACVFAKKQTQKAVVMHYERLRAVARSGVVLPPFPSFSNPESDWSTLEVFV